MKNTDHILVLGQSGWMGVIHLTEEEQDYLDSCGEEDKISFWIYLSDRYGFNLDNSKIVRTSSPDIHYYERGKEVN